MDTVIIASFVCVGLHVAMEEGMVLGFMRKPFIKLPDEIEKYTNQIKMLEISERSELIEQRERAEIRVSLDKHKAIRRRLRIKMKLLKPLVLCGICFASTYGSATYIFMHGVDWGLLFHIPATTAINTIVTEKLI